MQNDTPTVWQQTYETWIAALNSAYLDLIVSGTKLIPHLLGALLLLASGWLLAFLLRAAIQRLGSGVDRLFQSARLRTTTDLPSRWPASRIVANAAYWLVIVFFISVAASVLKLPYVADLFRQLLVYLPMFLLLGLGLFVLYALTGLIAERVVGICRARGLDEPQLLGKLARAFLLVIAVIVGATQLGLEVGLLVNLVTLVAAALFGGIALAFGLGAGDVVGNMIAAHTLRNLYRVGQRVRIEDSEGLILELTPSAVVMDGREGRIVVPARRFLDAASVLLEEPSP